MAHDHHHEVSQGEGKARRILFAFIFNLCFAIAEFIGGLWLNSTAILSNGLHDFGDSLSLLFSLGMERVSRKKRSHSYSYGYKRFSTLAALVNGIILIIGAVFILSKAIPRLLNPVHPNVHGMLIFAIVGLAINLGAIYFLRKGSSLNERVVTWHLMDDLLGWFAVLAVSIVMLFWDLHILDPILSIILTLYFLWNVLSLLKQTLHVFLQGVPRGTSVQSVEEAVKKFPGVLSLHDTHIWSLDGENIICTTHVVLSKKYAKQSFEIKKKIHAALREQGIHHATTEIEVEHEHCELHKC